DRASRSPSPTRRNARSASPRTSRSTRRTRSWRSIAMPRAGSGWTSPPGIRGDGPRARPATSTWCGSGARRVPDRISRQEHALRHGPTIGDRVRLGDTDLWIRIEDDLTEPADQVLWGYAKNLRSRMGQHDRATSESELDAVIGGAIVVDPLVGIVKADVGIKDGRVVGIGRAGNPDITDGVDLTIGLKVHEDWGASARIVDATLTMAEAFDVAVCLHTDGLNESGELEETVAAIAGRSVHAYHVEGAGGGHIPDLLAIVREPNVICSSTTPSLPYGRAAAAEHVDMILIVHEGNPSLPEDVAAARERIHPKTLAAEGPLHELGAISIVNSDSQGMGRIGETVRRTWQLAHAMKSWRASAAGEGWPDALPIEDDDNRRVLRYLAKHTVEPARTHGLHEEVGSLAPSHLADLVLWEPSSFSAKPLAVMKGGAIAWGPIGEGNASVHAAEPTRF